jgi:hypothetical protein
VSFRTIIEINHDLGHMIDTHPDAFVRLLGSYIRGADPNLVEALERYGIRVVETAHHSTEREVIVGTRHYPL